MKKLITVSLNGNPYSLEEDAHEKLKRYLEDAARVLANNPDRPEILADLEQAVADQCNERRAPHQTVITAEVLEAALREMGPVEDSNATNSGANNSAGSGEKSAPPSASGPVLQQISERAYVSGVCAGVARYFDVEVTLVRVAALLLLFFSGGTMALIYAVMMLLIPFAPTNGEPLRALPAKLREWVLALRAKLSGPRHA
jgi:phage shock protein PspC (stress-responsive transcriptional regulator)